MEISYLDDLVVSPSQTSLWLQCHTLWRLEQQHGLSSVAVRKGRFVASCIHTMRQGKSLASAMRDNDKHLLVQLASLATRETTTHFGAPLYTELKLGKARLDEVFVCQNNQGSFPLILDYKYHEAIDGPLQGALLARGYAYSHQLMHYAWAYLQYTNAWYMSAPEHDWLYIGVCLMTEQPRLDVATYLWLVEKWRIALWLQEALKIWQAINYQKHYASEGGALLKNTNACHSALYGDCSMYKRCWSASLSQPTIIEEYHNG